MEERAVSRLDRFITLINQLRAMLPPLKAVIYEAFRFVLAVAEAVRPLGACSETSPGQDFPYLPPDSCF
jgi:hypothetical protein